MRAADDVADEAQVVRGDADAVEAEHHGGLVEQADGDALAVRGGHGGDAHVDLLAGDLAANTTVLRQALLGDVEAGHDLDAGDDAGEVRLGGALDLVEDAVDAVADGDLLVAGLDVDVAGLLLGGVEDEAVDEADDRGVLGRGVQDVLVLLGVLLGLLLEVDILGATSVDAVDEVEDGGPRHQGDLEVLGAVDLAQVVEVEQAQGVGREHAQQPELAVEVPRQDGVAAGVLDRELLDQLVLDVADLDALAAL